MAAVKQSPDNFLRIGDRKTRMLSKAAFEEFETDRESCGSSSSSSSDLENYSPKSVVSKLGRWPPAAAAVKDGGINVDVFGRCRVHSRIARIRSEDSQLGEDVGECLIARFSAGAGSDHELVEDVVFSRSASPLSGKASSK